MRERLEQAMLVPVPADPGDALSRWVDLKGLAKIEPFSGLEREWPAWKYRFQSTMGLIGGMEELLSAAAREPEPFDEGLLPDHVRQRSHLLWALLVHVCRGRAFLLVKVGVRNAGFSAWQRLCGEYDHPRQVGKQLAQLTGILEPVLPAGNAAFMDKLLEWEFGVHEFQASTSILIPEAILRAVVLNKAPRQVRQFLL